MVDASQGIAIVMTTGVTDDVRAFSTWESAQHASVSMLARLTIKLGPPMPPPEIVEMEKRLLERAERLRAK